MTDCLIWRNDDIFYKSLPRHVKETQRYDTDIQVYPRKKLTLQTATDLWNYYLEDAILVNFIYLITRHTLPLLFRILLAHIFLKNETCAGIN